MRVIIAARLSRKQKNGGEGIGLDTQDERSREFCQREEHEVIAVTRDTISGSKAPTARKNLGAWLREEDKLAEYDAIVAYASDRLSRGNDSDWSTIEAWAVKAGKTLIIVGPDGGIQYPSRHDSDYWQWAALKRQAGKELDSIKERTGRARDAIRAAGGWTGSVAWGYETAGPKYQKTVVPTALGAAVVPEMFARCIADESLSAIARWMEAQTGREWWPRTVGQMLRNPWYMGHATSEEGAIIAKVPALVTADVFEQAQLSLAGRPKRGPVARTPAMLRGAIFCPVCETSPMYRISPQNKRLDGTATTLDYYRCSGRGANRKGCGNMVSLSLVDAAVNRIASAHFSQMVYRRVLVLGHDWEADLLAVNDELKRLGLRGLPRGEEQAERERLWAMQDELSAKTADEPAWSYEVDDRHPSYLIWWNQVPVGERGKWLTDNTFTVTATRDMVRVQLPWSGEWVSEPLTGDALAA